MTRRVSTALRRRTCLRYTGNLSLALCMNGAKQSASPEFILLARWIVSNSSREMPEPTATHVNGDSAS